MRTESISVGREGGWDIRFVLHSSACQTLFSSHPPNVFWVLSLKVVMKDVTERTNKATEEEDRGSKSAGWLGEAFFIID